MAAIALGAIYKTTKKSKKTESSSKPSSQPRKGGKGNVDREFWQKVVNLIKEIIPSWRCNEVSYVVITAGLLIVRTLMSIWLADVNGRVVKAIVNKDLKMFIYRVSTISLKFIMIVDFCSILIRFALINS